MYTTFYIDITRTFYKWIIMHFTVFLRSSVDGSGYYDLFSFHRRISVQTEAQHVIMTIR